MNWKGQISFVFWGKVREIEEANQQNLTEDCILKLAEVDRRLREYGTGLDTKCHSYLYEWMTSDQVRFLMDVKGFIHPGNVVYHPLLNDYYV